MRTLDITYLVLHTAPGSTVRELQAAQVVAAVRVPLLWVHTGSPCPSEWPQACLPSCCASVPSMAAPQQDGAKLESASCSLSKAFQVRLEKVQT